MKRTYLLPLFILLAACRQPVTVGNVSTAVEVPTTSDAATTDATCDVVTTDDTAATTGSISMPDLPTPDPVTAIQIPAAPTATFSDSTKPRAL